MKRATLLACLLAAAPLIAGCTSPNTYATARTLAQGDVTHTIAIEGIAHHGPQGTGALPILPTYVFRVGLADRWLDVGARVGSLTEIGADLKLNLLRGPLDLAIAPGAEAFIEWHYDPDPHSTRFRRTGSRAWFHMPLIVSYNFSKKLSLVGTPGIAYVIGQKVNDNFVRTQVFDGGTIAARLGVGIDYRWTKRAAVHPEITLLQSTSEAQTIVMFGLGFNFGSLPNYDDVEKGSSSSQPDEQPKPPEPSKPAEPPPPTPSKPAEPPPPSKPPEPPPPGPAPEGERPIF